MKTKQKIVEDFRQSPIGLSAFLSIHSNGYLTEGFRDDTNEKHYP